MIIEALCCWPTIFFLFYSEMHAFILYPLSFISTKQASAIFSKCAEITSLIQDQLLALIVISHNPSL